MNTSSRRLAVVLSHPVQYYSPWLRDIAQASGWQLRVFYLWDFGIAPRRDPQFGRTVEWDIDLLSGYESEFVPNLARDQGTHRFLGLDNPEIGRRLAAWQPDALLLFGYKWKTHLRALWWAKRRRVPILLRGDSHWLGRGPPGPLRRLLLGLLFRQFQGFLSVGQANRDYYHQLGVPAARIFFAPHAVEAERFNPDCPSALAQAAGLRAQLRLGDRRVLLFAGKFHAGKQPVELLKAYLSLAGPDNALVYVGDGVERGRLQRLADERPEACVRILPFANQSEMPGRYLLGDIFVLPSRGSYETWGLAVNEAMHMRRPCIVSDLVGCQRDLVEPGVTGWVFPASDGQALADTLRQALAIPRPELQALGTRAGARVASYSYRRATEGLLGALAAIRTEKCASR